ncbi:DNA/RNA nuclease SfsA [Mangrovitalea sediminis]|uniref:DNA/RNA nuclease SfsA n=1 Tax=Mangrovitalea sediminis TaxID=1982043 RepID=UPI000BE580AE|nr:DNA/RNA nuclease SfsA [Mangrovitalea sediminis]
MQFGQTLIEGTFLRRYKRFFADIELPDGEVVTAHCPNTGSMLGCNLPGSRVWVSAHDDPRRKLRFTWQLVEVEHGALACINTALPNRIVGEAIAAGRIPELSGYGKLQSEVRYGEERSRIDWLLSEHAAGLPDAYVEVKNVTLAEAELGLFPDAVTTRGQKHIRELMAMAAAGKRAVLFFCVSHTGIERVEPAVAIDPVYARWVREAVDVGVEFLAWRAAISPESITLERAIPFSIV